MGINSSPTCLEHLNIQPRKRGIGKAFQGARKCTPNQLEKKRKEKKKKEKKRKERTVIVTPNTCLINYLFRCKASS